MCVRMGMPHSTSVVMWILSKNKQLVFDHSIAYSTQAIKRETQETSCISEANERFCCVSWLLQLDFQRLIIWEQNVFRGTVRVPCLYPWLLVIITLPETHIHTVLHQKKKATHLFRFCETFTAPDESHLSLNTRKFPNLFTLSST